MKHTELKGPQGMLTVSYSCDFVTVVLGIPAEHIISTHKYSPHTDFPTEIFENIICTVHT